MATMIRLTHADGKGRHVWVNADAIAYVESRAEDRHTRIVFIGVAEVGGKATSQKLRVTESPDEVAQAIRADGRS